MEKEIKKVNDEISVAAFDPEENSFKSFAEKGFKSVINLQTDEEEQNVSPEKEEALAKDNDLEYRHIGVSEDKLSEALVDNFRQELENLPKPIVVHCKSGKRSGALVMMHIGCDKDMSGEEVIKQAEDMGFECDVPELEQFLKKYVNEH
ncbi:beta-lactamase hydrolase domain-containing protein [Autumnicola psychrophila]|uniref:Sulfur transferase domain-containing protein n=1 Tax=Autumnicola psychrophila TaxID=3075592 RepID=A0ABU3DRZ5_9FLAO|nr:sulfur transferase domain-containing protein [Zunongwangia sp. F225]MDT0686484.1 sulfur transferase domain-containing protein [Zunongwangia sp. F225]